MSSTISSKKEWCTPRYKTYFKEETSPTCLSADTLRKLARDLGGPTFSKKLENLKTVKQAFGPQVPETEWLDVVRHDKLKALYQNKKFEELSVQKQQAIRKREKERREYAKAKDLAFKPRILEAPGQWLSVDSISAYLQMLRDASNYHHLAVWAGGCPPPDTNLKDYYLAGHIIPNRHHKQETWAVPRIAKKWNRYLMVHNTAPPFSLGYHWVAILIDRTKSTPGLEFYDSISKGEPSSESHIGRTWAQFKKWNDKKLFSEKPLPVRVNTVKVQTQGVECGMFALRFLTQRLQGKTMAELDQRNAVNDSACAALRSKYFLPYKSPASKAKEVATAAKSLIDFNELKMKVRKCIAEKEKLPSAKNLPKGVLQLKPFFKVTISADQKKAKVEFDKDVKISQPKKYKYIIIGIEIDGKLKNAALMDVTNKRLLFATTAKTKALKKLFRDHENKLWQNLL